MKQTHPKTLPAWNPNDLVATRESLMTAVNTALTRGTNADHQLAIVQLEAIVSITQGFANAIVATLPEISGRSKRRARRLRTEKWKFEAVANIAKDALAHLQERTPFEFPRDDD